MRLENKVAIITGASAGIGRAAALRFAKEGATVVAVARRKEKLEQLAIDAKDYAGQIIPYAGDVSLREVNEGMIDFAMQQFGRVDILVNNAGVMDNYTPVGDVLDEDWDRVMKINLYGPMAAIRYVLPIMMEQPNGGSIVNVASVTGAHGGRSGAAYVTSKAGLINLSTHTAFVYANKKIRCNCLNPGGVSTEISTDNPNTFGMERAFAGLNLMTRVGEADELASAIVFLASDEASYVNGAVLTVDGGWTAY
ncbi:MAG: glucose 1-dehydrogenase [Peptococcaceae bacterium]|nr:glucose 1-dehydrogenase [Peptococcaceae bacterium]MBO5430239.1 glucose 1-dehydrogenase [Peptococcaceae bacterium]MBP3625136.1 glucose 1-dehydrogenase [Peptococcaceae bacterium]